MPRGEDAYRVDSERAGGRYTISCSAAVTCERLEDKQKAMLTSWLVQSRIQGDKAPWVHTHHIDEQRRPLTVNQRAEYLLRYIESEISHIGQAFDFEPCTAHANGMEKASEKRFASMLAWSESLNCEELEFLLGFLEQWIDRQSHGKSYLQYHLTVCGYEHLNAIRDHIF